jgi:hypothetical protein
VEAPHAGAFEVKGAKGRARRGRFDIRGGAALARTNFEFQKRQKELEKKRKKEEKKQKKLERAAEPPAEGAVPADATTEPSA